jgi:hypothetical protein
MIYPHAMLRTNTHIHTPYSFSPFETMERIVASAKEEDIAALGINDNATCEGFAEFAALCSRFRIYPIFNMEFLVRQDDLKTDTSLRNAPADRGFLYLCGKSLMHPLDLSTDHQNLLVASWKKTQDHVWGIIGRLNDYLTKVKIDISIDYNDVRKRYAKKIVHERHVARALHDALIQTYTIPAAFENALTRLSGGEALAAHRHDPVWIQNEIYDKVLVSNPAVASSTEKIHYMRLHEAFSLILDGGGIPCYSIGAITVNRVAECENEAAKLAETLERSRIFAVDFFPLRNEFEILKTYARVFAGRGFCITFGTGQNTPERMSFVPAFFGNQPLDEDLSRIGWEGACILAAHQEMRKTNRSGFVDNQGALMVTNDSRSDFIAIGEKAIRKAAGL